MGTVSMWLVGWAVCSLVTAIAFAGWVAAATQRQLARAWVEASVDLTSSAGGRTTA